MTAGGAPAEGNTAALGPDEAYYRDLLSRVDSTIAQTHKVRTPISYEIDMRDYVDGVIREIKLLRGTIVIGLVTRS